MSEAKRRVVVIGHVTSAPNALAMPKNMARAARLVKMHNFTRVATSDSQLVDHIAYLKSLKNKDPEERFSVWEMLMCAGLLLKSHLARNGFAVKLVNYIDSDVADNEYAAIRDFSPNIVVISTTFVLSQKHLVDIGSRVRREVPNALIVAGGHHVFTTLLHMNSRQREQYFLASEIDVLVNDSQGEAALLSICNAYPGPFGSIPNVIWKSADGTVVENAMKAEDNDINDTLIDFSDIEPGSVVHVRTARSCGFKCAFCSYPTIAGDLAQMDVENVVLTLRKAQAAGVKALFFVDDTFNVPRPRFEKLVDRMIKEGFTIPWYSFLRCQYVDEALVKKMAQSGCRGVFLGIESGSNRILKNMKKGAVVDFYRRSIKWLRDAGIITVGSFIVGFPGETSETVEATHAFIEESGLEYYFIQPFYYLHHTPVHSRAAEWGLSGDGLFWSHNTMDWTQAIEHVNKLFLEIKKSVFVNPDYTLWELAFLMSKGMSADEVKDYRLMINEMTREQMTRFGVVDGNLTSRVA